MFVYNITYKVDNKIAAEWMKWQKEMHIPSMLATHLFYDHRFYELLEQDDAEGKTFVIQFFAKTKKDYEDYIYNHSKTLRSESMKKWGNQFITFRTLLQAIK